MELYKLMVYFDLSTLKSFYLTCKSIKCNLKFWKMKYDKDRLPLLGIKTTFIDWIKDYERMTKIKSMAYKLRHVLPIYDIHIRYNYEQLKYKYYKESYSIHHLLMNLLPLDIQKQIIEGDGGKYQELVIYDDGHFQMVYHENYLIAEMDKNIKVPSVSLLFIYILYYCPNVNIYLHQISKNEFIKYY